MTAREGHRMPAGAAALVAAGIRTAALARC